MKKNQRIKFILFVLACLGMAVAIALTALKDNVSFFFAPADIVKMQDEGSPQVAAGHVFRLGGMVKEGSLTRDRDTPTIRFTVTDMVEEVKVQYTGILPDLFREGQGVVAKGGFNENGVFIASELLAKHDENYMPPEVAKALKKQHEGK